VGESDPSVDRVSGNGGPHEHRPALTLPFDWRVRDDDLLRQRPDVDAIRSVQNALQVRFIRNDGSRFGIDKEQAAVELLTPQAPTLFVGNRLRLCECSFRLRHIDRRRCRRRGGGDRADQRQQSKSRRHNKRLRHVSPCNIPDHVFEGTTVVVRCETAGSASNCQSICPTCPRTLSGGHLSPRTQRMSLLNHPFPSACNWHDPCCVMGVRIDYNHLR
jgi:hypothetical protein